jgi:hypothetical protein
MNLAELVDCILQWRDATPNGSKRRLADAVIAKSDLQLDKALLVGSQCVLRISQMQESGNESNALAAFHKICDYDDKPVLVCLMTSRGMRLLLANTTFLEKVSERSYKLAADNLVGGVLESDLLSAVNGVANLPANFEALWATHTASDRTANIQRIVTATQEMHARAAAANPDSVKGR